MSRPARAEGRLRSLEDLKTVILTSFLLELVVYPAIYEVWKARGLER